MEREESGDMEIKGARLEVKNLSHRYGGVPAVDDVNIIVEGGEFCTILGPSGSGKTTTLMAIAGFLSPDEGSITVDGEEIIDLPPNKRDLGVVFQNYALFPHMSVYENVAFPLKMRRERRKDIKRRVYRALERVGLEEYAKRKPKELSGGQQQRVALARAIIYEPRVLLLDEPLAALDRKLRSAMQIELKQLQRSLGITMVFVTHDQGEALTMSDQIVVMDRACVQQAGTPRSLYSCPTNYFVADFMGESNFVPIDAVRAVDERFLSGKPRGGTRELQGGLHPGTDRNGPLVLQVRPEDVRVRRATEVQDHDENTVEGIIVDVAYFGDSLRVRVSISEIIVNGSELVFVAKLPLTDMNSELQIGDNVVVTWRAENSRFIAVD